MFGSNSTLQTIIGELVQYMFGSNSALQTIDR